MIGTDNTPKVKTKDLLPGIDLDALLAGRDAKLAAYERAVAACETKTHPAFDGGNSYGTMFKVHSRLSSCRPCGRKEAQQEVDRSAWRFLMAHSGLWAFMDQQARAEWDKALERGDFPELTKESICGTFARIHADRGMMVARGIAECFNRLSIDHRTNSRTRFTTRMIFNYMRCQWSSEARVSTGGAAQLDDLNRAVHILRGLPEPSHEQSADTLLGGYGSGRKCGEWYDFGAYFRVMFFKKGTGHVEFKYEDDRRRLNKALSLAESDNGKKLGGNRYWYSRDKRSA